MGLFDDFTNFVNEAQSLREEATKLGSDIAKELVNGATDMKQTVTDMADEVKSAVKPDSDTSQNSSSTATDEQ